MTGRLPPGVVAYRRTPVFTEATLPTALRHRHRTKAGVWGAITVVSGRLRLRRLDPAAETVLDAATPGIVAPEEAHAVEPLGPVRFFIEFHAAPAKAEGGSSGLENPADLLRDEA